MKKLLPIVLFFTALFFPSNSFAQSSTDCWSTHMIRQYSVCTKAHTECLSPCSVLKTTPERKGCFEDCGKAKDVCTDKAVADYRACIEASRRSDQLSPSPQSVTIVPTNTSTVGPTPPFSFIDLPIIDSFEPVFVGIIGFDTAISRPSDKQFNDIVGEDMSGELLNRNPSITIEDEKKVSIFEPGYVDEKMRVLDSGKVQYKSAVTGEWADIQPEIFLPERSMFQGDWLKLSLDVGQTEKIPAVLSLSNFQAEVTPDTVDLQMGEIEFKIKSWADTIKKTHPVFTIKTDNAQISTKDTHFWVSYDKDKEYTLVGVYEGKVEVKTKDGKIATVTPNSDKPGVLLVSQKLSPIKLAIIGLALVTVIGGGALFLKRKFAAIGFKKKK